MSTPGSFQKRGACGVFMSHVEAETPADHPREWGKAVQSSADRPKPEGCEMGASAVRITYASQVPRSCNSAHQRPASASSLMKKKKYAWSSRLNLEYNRMESAIRTSRGEALYLERRVWEMPKVRVCQSSNGKHRRSSCPLPHPLRNRQPSLSSPPASTATRDIRSCRVYSIAPLQPVVTVT